MNITLIGDLRRISLRAFARDVVTGELIPTRHGLDFPIAELPELVAVAKRALRQARKKGWVPEEEEQ